MVLAMKRRKGITPSTALLAALTLSTLVSTARAPAGLILGNAEARLIVWRDMQRDIANGHSHFSFYQGIGQEKNWQRCSAMNAESHTS